MTIKTEKQCLKCGVVHTNLDHMFYYMEEVKPIYQVSDHVDICGYCADMGNVFVNYLGSKKQNDKDRLQQYLVSGVLPMRQFYAQMNGGYYGRT